MTTYRVHRELHFARHLGVYMAFGIGAYHQKQLTFRIADVFLNHSQAAAFVALCNREQPDWRHLYDILEDVM